MNDKAFTLIELLIVIAILAILATTVTLVLNPAELIKQSRDSTRLSDLRTLDSALSIHLVDTGGIQNYGSSDIVYLSLPDSSSTCVNHTLPSLPSGWSYNCVTEENLTNIDSTGWIPVDFTTMSISSPLARLPIDPTNTDTDGKYYTYVAGSWELSAKLESDKRAETAAEDGRYDTSRYYAGNKKNLAPFIGGLVGYWPMDEGEGSIANELSSVSNYGFLIGGTSWVSDERGDSLSINGSDNSYVDISISDALSNTTEDISVAIWFKRNGSAGGSNTSGYHGLVKNITGNGWRPRLLVSSGGEFARWEYSSPGLGNFGLNTSGYNFPINTWRHIVVRKSSFGTEIFIDGNLAAQNSSMTHTISNGMGNLWIGTGADSNQYVANGLIGDVRIYNKALSASEIQALYNATR